MVTGLRQRLERAAEVSGVDEPCPACEAARRYDARCTELARSLGIPPLDASRTYRLNCPFCRGALFYPVGFFTPEEVAAFVTFDGYYFRGEMCLPEAEEARKAEEAAADRAAEFHYGALRPAYERLLEKYRTEMDEIKTMRLSAAYLRRVPGCECDYPKTVEEWRESVEANGWRVDARL